MGMEQIRQLEKSPVPYPDKRLAWKIRNLIERELGGEPANKRSLVYQVWQLARQSLAGPAD